MEELLDGLADGGKEWRNVSYIVRKAFGVVFNEMDAERSKMEMQAAAHTAAVRRIEALEAEVADVVRGVEKLEKRQKQYNTTLKTTEAEQDRLSHEAERTAAATSRVRDTIDSLSRNLRFMPSLEDVSELLDKRDADSDKGALLLAARSAAGVSPAAKWSAPSSLTTQNKTGSIEWTRREVLSGDCRCFEWRSSAPHSIYVAKAGVYEVTAGVFSSRVPRMALYVNAQEVLVSRCCRSYVTTKGSAIGCSDRSCDQISVTGQTMSDLIWLPASAKLTLRIETDARQASGVKVRDAVCMLRFVQ